MPLPETPNYRVDLHCHTTRSDGNDTPLELIQNAAALGMKVIAITDHDVLPPETIEKDGSVFPLSEIATDYGITVVPGIEISCDTLVDDVHIVGFLCDWKSPAMTQIVEFAEESKVNSYRELVEKLGSQGFNLTWNELLLDGKRQPEAVQKKHIFELLAAKKYAPTWSDAKIMVRDNPNYDIKREKPDPIEAIRTIHGAGGIAILAHPYLIDETVAVSNRMLSRDEYIRRLIDAGIDGIESRYTYDKTSYKGSQSKEEIRREVEERYASSVDFLSGGSDYHADHKKGTKNARQIGEAGVPEEYFYSHPTLRRLIMVK